MTDNDPSAAAKWLRRAAEIVEYGNPLAMLASYAIFNATEHVPGLLTALADRAVEAAQVRADEELRTILDEERP